MEVGERTFKTTVKTLKKSGYFLDQFSYPNNFCKTHYFLDRDPDLFADILYFLRMGKFPSSRQRVVPIIVEAEGFYMVHIPTDVLLTRDDVRYGYVLDDESWLEERKIAGELIRLMVKHGGGPLTFVISPELIDEETFNTKRMEYLAQHSERIRKTCTYDILQSLVIPKEMKFVVNTKLFSRLAAIEEYWSVVDTVAASNGFNVRIDRASITRLDGGVTYHQAGEGKSCLVFIDKIAPIFSVSVKVM